MKTRLTVAAVLAAGLLIACAGAPKSIPDTLTARELVQKAQEASDVYNYEASIAYYKALGDRFASDAQYRTESEYEIAFIAYKQGHYAQAKEQFDVLVAQYSAPDGASLPSQYQILAKKVLQSIGEKLKKQQQQ